MFQCWVLATSNENQAMGDLFGAVLLTITRPFRGGFAPQLKASTVPQLNAAREIGGNRRVSRKSDPDPLQRMTPTQWKE